MVRDGQGSTGADTTDDTTDDTADPMIGRMTTSRPCVIVTSVNLIGVTSVDNTTRP